VGKGKAGGGNYLSFAEDLQSCAHAIVSAVKKKNAVDCDYI